MRIICDNCDNEFTTDIGDTIILAIEEVDGGGREFVSREEFSFCSEKCREIFRGDLLDFLHRNSSSEKNEEQKK